MTNDDRVALYDSQEGMVVIKAVIKCVPYQTASRGGCGSGKVELASSPGRFTEFGRSERVLTNEGKNCHICEPLTCYSRWKVGKTNNRKTKQKNIEAGASRGCVDHSKYAKYTEVMSCLKKNKKRLHPNYLFTTSLLQVHALWPQLIPALSSVTAAHSTARHP